jgi:hypothetical protein
MVNSYKILVVVKYYKIPLCYTWTHDGFNKAEVRVYKCWP